MYLEEVKEIMKREKLMYEKILKTEKHLYKLGVYDKSEEDIKNIERIIDAYTVVLKMF